MSPSAIPSHERQRLQKLPEYRALSTTTLVLPVAFAAVPVLFGVVITALKTGGQNPALADLGQFQGFALALSFLITLAIIIVIPGYVAKGLSQRISKTDDTVPARDGNERQSSDDDAPPPPEMIPYAVSLALLELPLVLIFIGCLIGGFTFDALVVAAGAFLFGLAVMVSKVRPVVLEVVLQRLRRQNVREP